MNSHAAINRICRPVWSHPRQMWAPAAETSRGRCKGRGRLAAALLLVSGPALAELPAQGSISSGSGSINSKTLSRALSRLLRQPGATPSTSTTT